MAYLLQNYRCFLYFLLPPLRQNERINDGSVSFAVHSHMPCRPYRGNGAKRARIKRGERRKKLDEKSPTLNPYFLGG